MNDEIKKVLQSGRDDILEMQRKRKLQEEENNLKTICGNSDKFNQGVIDTIIKKYFDTILYSMYETKDEQPIEVICDLENPETLYLESISNDEYKKTNLESEFWLQFDKKDREMVEFYKEYNKTHKNKIVCCRIFDKDIDNDRDYVIIPVIINWQLLENMGFTNTDNVNEYIRIRGSISSCEKLINKVINNKISDIYFSEDYIRWLQKKYDNIKKRYNIVQAFKERSKRTKDIITLDICKKAIEEYKKDQILSEEYLFELPMTCFNNMEDYKNLIGRDELKRVKEFNKAINNSIKVLYIKYTNNNETTYLPILRDHFINFLHEIAASYLRNNYNNKEYIKIQTEQFEEMVINLGPSDNPTQKKH